MYYVHKMHCKYLIHKICVCMHTKCKMLLKCSPKQVILFRKVKYKRHKNQLLWNTLLYLRILCGSLFYVRPRFLFYFQIGEAYNICIKGKQRINWNKLPLNYMSLSSDFREYFYFVWSPSVFFEMHRLIIFYEQRAFRHFNSSYCVSLKMLISFSVKMLWWQTDIQFKEIILKFGYIS